METTKKPWTSKTVIINAIMGLIATVSIFFPAASGIGEFITNHATTIGVIWSVINVAVRFITHDKVQLTD